MKIYNTLTRKKEEFIPIKEGQVSMYVCGPTVYDFFHIGNARPFIVFDTIRRYFEYKGYRVIYVQNFTDIDDKMINRANKEGISVVELADRYIDEYYRDADKLGIKRAVHNPRATEHIEEIIEHIKVLLEKGYAYETEGDVYFQPLKFNGYGKLSHQDIDELQLGSRIEVSKKKREPMDFVLWKKHKEGEPWWESPWGKGRPGWHIECSVMAKKYLGETIDIHAGGQDLVFPHHENEIAQSESASGKSFANYWMHNGYININNRKMSKSLGNFFTVREISQEYDLEVVRFFMLSAHYRNPVNYSREMLEQAKNGLDRLYNAIDILKHLLENGQNKLRTKNTNNDFQSSLKEYKNKFIIAMDDDLNTADAVSVIFELVKYINTGIKDVLPREDLKASYDILMELLNVLGIFGKEDNVLDLEIEELINMRQEARQNKDWARSDQIRDELKKLGIILEDTPDGVRWKKL